MEVAMHFILHARQVYPQETFQRAVKYGVPVWISRHPELKGYIQDVVDSIRPDMLQGRLRQVLLVIQARGATKETFVFDVAVPQQQQQQQQQQGVDAGDLGAEPAARRRSVASLASSMDASAIDSLLNGFMLQLGALDSLLQPYQRRDESSARDDDGDDDSDDDDDTEFHILVRMADDQEPATKASHGVPWIAGEQDAVHVGVVGRSGGNSNGDGARSAPSVVPIKTMDTGVLRLQLQVQQPPAQ
ncbi:DNA-binding protein [Entophlyctis helioformis]|nr:DNA-binding protein [Entophlyctis helioformis]